MSTRSQRAAGADGNQPAHGHVLLEWVRVRQRDHGGVGVVECASVCADMALSRVSSIKPEPARRPIRRRPRRTGDSRGSASRNPPALALYTLHRSFVGMPAASVPTRGNGFTLTALLVPGRTRGPTPPSRCRAAGSRFELESLWAPRRGARRRRALPRRPHGSRCRRSGTAPRRHRRLELRRCRSGSERVTARPDLRPEEKRAGIRRRASGPAAHRRIRTEPAGERSPSRMTEWAPAGWAGSRATVVRRADRHRQPSGSSRGP